MKIKDFENMVIYKATNPDNIKGEAASVETGTKPTYHVDSSPLSEDEVKDFKQLYDNDFGARNERVLDYNHPEYIKSGINKVDWGKESSDFSHAETLAPGEVISRYGNDSGKYFGDIGTDFDSRQLPYSEDKFAPKYYEVIKPFSVEQSTIAEQKKWNDSEVTHTAQQYKTNESEEWLRNNGYIREISKEKAYELCPSGKTGISDKRGSRSLNYDLNNADLFNENKKGDYTYGKTEYGKVAFGNLKLETGKRDSAAQRTVGNDDRRPTDDGGHLIGTR
ncbi:MAG: TNT domain-containing protein, partial [Oscillospiraceae bacterium]|nr:TNT domain-containing protein [Oscillospiraceae bacterium]